MALSKEDRVTMSKKIVGIPDENAIVENVKLQILAQQQIAIKNDAVNAALQAPYNEKINAYQAEYNLIDGNLRTVLTEDLINAAAKGENRNGFFMANPDDPIPSVPDGVWKFFAPMSFCYAIGKDNNEEYGVEPLGEVPIISRINDLISEIETYIIATRASGKKCIQNPGDQIVSSPEIQGLLDDLKNEIQTWEDSLNAQKSVIQIGDSSVSARQAENQIAYDEIDPLISIIDAWQTVQDFDITTSIPNNCAGFSNAGYTSFCTDPQYTDQFSCEFNGQFWFESFQDSKLSPTQIQILKDAIVDRSVFLTTREGQLDSYFGTINQDTNTGELLSQSGWYGARFLILDSRINLISGSANGKFGAERGLKTQDQIKSSNETAAAAYNLSMKATKAVAPGLDTPYLNVLDASEFNIGDQIYVVANDQEELSGTILEKDGNRVKLSFVIPKKYNLGNLTRLYRLVNTPI